MSGDAYLITTYFTYGAIAVGLTMWLARTLYAHGALFLAEVFDNLDLANAVNRLLVTGFYMLNLGYAFLLFRTDTPTVNALDATELLITKLGILLVSLGVIHFVNMLVFWKIRNRALEPDPAFPSLPPGVGTNLPPGVGTGVASSLPNPPAAPNFA